MKNLRHACLMLVAVLTIVPSVVFSQNTPTPPAGGNAPTAAAPTGEQNQGGERKERREKRHEERKERREKRHELRKERREKRREARKEHRKGGHQTPADPAQVQTPASK